jgi:hypothetical protein
MRIAKCRDTLAVCKLRALEAVAALSSLAGGVNLNQAY